MPDVNLGAVAGGSKRLSGYLARPEGPGPWPGVVVIHEVWGLDAVMRRQVDRVASAGYLGLGPDLYSDGGKARCMLRTFRALASGDGKALVDIEATRRWLIEQGDCTGKVGVLGFCMGGSFALVTSPRGFDAASANYGMLPKGAEEALAGACPIIGSFGGKDRTMRGMAPRLDSALTALEVPHDVKVYPEAGHSFLNDAPTGPRLLQPLMRVANVGPEPASAADAWARIDAFFAEHLIG
jgi:carboxymethylenebutenolidase